MIRLTSSHLRTHLAQTLEQVAKGKKRFVVQRGGKPFAALVPAEDIALLTRLRREIENREDLKAFRRAKKERGSISWAEAERRLDRLKD
ncbi:type II toxin-antitoxin system Phd/YefM family antitoxin [Candidatus Sumerlaeota bacterium]|nr:type II toxin-antitoxin system Phd/YefM family antitoxin [Candidatus Sumerlaeota bacterium]